MNELEKVLRADRAAGIPDPPDVAYTIAAVRRRAGQPAVRSANRLGEDWPLSVAAIGIVLGACLLGLAAGLSPWWLAGVPLVTLFLYPILLRKGA